MLAIFAAATVFRTQMTSADYAALAKESALAAIEQFKDQAIGQDQLGVEVGTLDRTKGLLVGGSFNGDKEMYPASVVKLFYLGYTAKLLEEKKLTLTTEFGRAIHDMIVDSINDATGLVLETVSGTTDGPELSASDLKRWMKKRQVVNDWYKSMGYTGVNACQKTWNEGPYGRERQGYGPNFELRNSLTPNACARLMSEIALDKIVTPEKCEWMRGFLHRKVGAEGDYQSKAFTGGILSAGTMLWSKAGYTDTVRHDVAYIKAADGREFVIVIFTKGHSSNEQLIPAISRHLLTKLGVLSA
jgi:hypothetical protein